MAGPAINDIDMLGYGMPISVFENRFDEPIVFSLEPHDERHELPPLARIGVRYSFGPDQVDRTFADIGRNEIRFWCDSEHREVEIIYPNAFDLLLYDICVKGGFCGGGLVNDQPSHVTHLLPTTGIVTAEEFATLVLRAEGNEGGQPANAEHWSERLQSQFVAHMGRSSVPATELAQNLAQPFDIRL